MHPTPLRTLFNNAQTLWERYGDGETGVEMAGLFDHVDLEYAAIRKACGLLDQPHRGTLVITGKDRLEFLNRMVTQELKGFEPYTSRRTFWLNRKGRIDADLRLLNLGDRVVADVDVHAAGRAKAGLDSYVISEDVVIEDVKGKRHRLGLHGPGAAAVLEKFGTLKAGVRPGEMREGLAGVVEIGGIEVMVERWDSTGEAGFELTMDAGAAEKVYQTLLQAAHENVPGHTGPNPRPLLRPIGWHAYNIARIEAGTPLYLLDFGPNSLPAETGVLEDRVSFKKGCYLGQEIVARMHSLGSPKARLVAIRVNDPEAVGDQPLRQPVGGGPVFDARPENGKAPEPVGAVTSTTTSPMLGGAPIGFAMVKFKHGKPDTKLFVLCVTSPDAEPVLLEAVVQPQLAFWKRTS